MQNVRNIVDASHSCIRRLDSPCSFKKLYAERALFVHRKNLDPLSQHSDQEIWNALELSQIKDIVASHPEGLST